MDDLLYDIDPLTLAGKTLEEVLKMEIKWGSYLPILDRKLTVVGLWDLHEGKELWRTKTTGEEVA